MTATQHPDHDGRGLPIFHADGSTNTEALASLVILAAEQDLVLISRADLRRLLGVADEATSAGYGPSPDEEAALSSAAVLASNPVSLALLP